MLILAASACGAVPDGGEWRSGSGPDFCSALRVGGSDVLSVTLGDGAASGIAVKARPFDAVTPDVPERAFQLLVDGRPTGSAATGVRFGGGAGPGAGLHFPLNIRQLLRRHPRGFSLAVLRDGRQVYATQVTDLAQPAFEEMERCDRGRRFPARR